ncbi:hypothetical protein, partial [Mesorhizobium sp. M7A.F.Ca.CA.002.04.1.1]|uniref:hypothetical protein n=1 Tax=Mesorhizobium sp. M7A.F.Ca.CA.002.04.1.1 TaxID=2496681 RepID=UPI0019D4A1A5
VFLHCKVPSELIRRQQNQFPAPCQLCHYWFLRRIHAIAVKRFFTVALPAHIGSDRSPHPSANPALLGRAML